MSREAPKFNGSNSCCPEYFNIFNGHNTSRDTIKEQNPEMVRAFDALVTKAQHYGQMTLPDAEGSIDIIYPPLNLNGHSVNGEVGMEEGLDYVLFQQ